MRRARTIFHNSGRTDWTVKIVTEGGEPRAAFPNASARRVTAPRVQEKKTAPSNVPSKTGLARRFVRLNKRSNPP